MRERPTERYPFPPQGDPFAPFPQEIPWGAPISDLSNWWLERSCVSCRTSGAYPLRLMAARHGWNITLRQIVEKAVCGQCKRRLSRLELVDDSGGDVGRAGAKTRRHDLLAG